MFNHAPPDYDCPFCRLIAGESLEDPWTRRDEVVVRDEHATAFVSARWWEAAPGHVIIVPNVHVENVYDVRGDTAAHVHETARRVAIALKRLPGCEGVSLRQHNEPAGNQEVWHYHLHLFPRTPGDRLYERHMETRMASPAERAARAKEIRAAFA